MQTLQLILPKPHPKQVELMNHPARRKVCCAGRRGGKTTLAAMVAVEKLMEGRRILLSSTTQEQADAFWDYAKVWLSSLIERGVIEKNEQRRILTFAARSGRLKVKTAWDADTLRGDYADFLVLDECALLSPDAWDKVGAPMLLDNDGDAWFISTPRRRNWFFHLYQKAQADTTGRWQAWHFTSYDNPYLSRSALDELSADMTEEAIEQEINARFLESEGVVFRNITPNLTAPLDATPEQHRGHAMYMGVDWAQKHDYTALSVGCEHCKREVALDRFNKISWDFQRARLRTLYDRWQVKEVLAEENSIGSPNIEALQDEGINVRGFQTTSVSKPPLIRSLVLCFERCQMQWLPIPVATGELEAYEAKVSANTGHTFYGAPEGVTDDTVIARALMWCAISNSPAPVTRQSNYALDNPRRPYTRPLWETAAEDEDEEDNYGPRYNYNQS